MASNHLVADNEQHNVIYALVSRNLSRIQFMIKIENKVEKNDFPRTFGLVFINKIYNCEQFCSNEKND